jgi:uncharacterized DUF497 family protein
LLFDWDPAKAASNVSKHRVSFEEAKTVFYDEEASDEPDLDHSLEEARMILVGMSDRLRVLTVIYTERGPWTRIISARHATSREKKRYGRRRRK